MNAQRGDLYKDDLNAYLAKLTRLVGGRDRLEILAETPDVLARIVGEHTVKQMRTRPFEEKWTPNEILGHLGDGEWVIGYRIRQILCEDRPRIYAMDHELWVSGQRHNERDPAELLAAFVALRSHNLALWRRMTPVDFQRSGTHSERGCESLDNTLFMHAGHDLSHIDQITRYLAEIERTA